MRCLFTFVSQSPFECNDDCLLLLLFFKLNVVLSRALITHMLIRTVTVCAREPRNPWILTKLNGMLKNVTLPVPPPVVSLYIIFKDVLGGIPKSDLLGATVALIHVVQSGHLFTCMTPWAMLLHELVHVIACWESMFQQYEMALTIEGSSNSRGNQPSSCEIRVL